MLHLVRHGRTDANARGLLLGRADPPLSDEGRAQAAALGSFLPHHARVVTSPLRRAVETAAAIAPDAEVDERWIELDYGEYDGLAPGDLPTGVWAASRADLSYAPPGGESLATLGERVRAACVDLAADAAQRDVIVVTHVSPVKAALAWALGTDLSLAWRVFVEVASIARVRVDGGATTVLSLNEHAR